MRKFLVLFVSSFISLFALSQNFSNKGNDFWLCFPSHVPNATTALPILSIYITSDQASTGTITMSNGAYINTFNLNAGNNFFQEIQINSATAQILNAESNTISKKSIRVKTDAGKPAVIVYAQQWAGARSAATLVLPTNVLGKKYYAISSSQAIPGTSGAGASYVSKSHFEIIAVKNNTVVQITPKFNGVAQTPFTITLPLAGDTYQYEPAGSNTDITGSYIESLASGTGGCLPIAVFSGTSGVTIGAAPCGTTPGSSDPLFQQAYPISSWGKNFGFIPFYNYLTGNPYRIMASEDNTSIFFNGALAAILNAGDIYPNTYVSNPPVLNTPTSITSDKPIAVAQFMQSNACSGSPVGGSLGDPDMVILNPIEQNISDITVFSSSNQAITQRYINVLLKTSATASFKINGAAPTGTWQTFAALPGYSYLQGQSFPGTGSYHLVADSGFNAIAYGYGANESYAYSAGTNVKDLYTTLGTSTTYGIDPGSVCQGTPMKFKISLPFQPDSIYWDLSAIVNIPQYGIEKILPLVPLTPLPLDSTTSVNLQPVYWYSLPNYYTFNTPGTYTIPITLFASNADGCGSEQEKDMTFTVAAPPVPDFLWISNGCPAEPMQFNDITVSTKPTYEWSWNFGDPASPNNTAISKNPTHIFTNSGLFTITFHSITTPGCVSSDVQHIVTIPALPTATINSNTTNVCLNGATPNITITGSGGLAPYDFTYTINGVTQPVATTNATGIYTIPVPTTVTGPFTYTLVSVKNSGSTVCTNIITGQSATVTVTPLPIATASVSNPTTVCLNGASPTVTFTGSGGVAPYTFNYTINSIAQAPIVSNGAGVATIPAATNVSGSFIYSLTSVSNAGTGSCTQTLTNMNVSVNVSAPPSATISASTNTVCLNGASPTITFTGTGGTAPYTFNYTFNGVAQVPVVSNAAGTFTIAVATNTAGPFVYALTSVQEGGPNLCSQPTITGQQVTVTVNALPVATITGATTVCLNALSPTVTFTGTGGTAPYTFAYTINGVAQTPIVSNGAGIATVFASTTIAGPFVYNITSITDGSSTVCTQAYTNTLSVTVTVKQLPSGSISGTTAVCLNSASPVITFTGTGGTAPYTFTYTINGVTQPPAISDAAGIYTTITPTNVATTYTYALASVQESSTNACIQINTVPVPSTYVTVNPLPTAAIAVSTPAVCLNGSATVTFTGTGSGPAVIYTFYYTINGIAQTPVVSNAAGIAIVNVNTGVSNTFNYALTSVKDGTATACAQNQSGTASIVVNPLPTPNFSFSTPSCNTRAISFTDNSVANAGTITGWAWNFGDASPIDNTQNPTHTFNNANNYTVGLTVTTSNGCSNATPFTKLVTINQRPATDFNVPTVACVSDNVLFTDITAFGTGIPNPAAYKWIFGDPTSPTNVQFAKDGTHQFTAGGTYTVTHISGSQAGCLDTVTHTITISSAAVTDFAVANAAALCVNDTVAITNVSTIAVGNINKLEIYWDYLNAPGTVVTDNAPVLNKVYKHKYPNFQIPTNKPYTILVRAFSGVSCTNDKTQVITVNAVPKVQFNAMPDACYDATPFQITQASETGGVTGTGTYTGAGVSATGLFSPKVAGIGIHAIKYTFTSIAGCIDSMSSNIKVLDTASAKFSYITPVCDGSLVVFKDESTSPAGVILGGTVCSMGDGTIINVTPGSTFTHTYATWGTYTVTMTAMSTYGCKSTAYTQQVTVHPIPQPAFAFGQTSVCLPNAAVSFINTSSIADNSGITYQWDFGGSPIDPLNSSTAKTPPPHIYTGAGPYTVKLVVIGATGTNGSCNATVSHMVNFIHPQPKAAFDFDKPTICIGDNVTVTDRTNGLDGTVLQRFWDFGDNIKGSAIKELHLYTAAQTYPVSLYIVNSQGCNSDTLTQQFVVNPYPVVDAGPDRVVLEGGSVTMQPVVTGNDLQYLWSPATYLNDVTLATPTANIILNDITYTLTVTGRGGCTAPSDNLFVKVLKAPKVPNTFTPNGDGINDVWSIDYLSTYPNCRVQVFTRSGQLVFESRGYKTPWDGTIKGRPLPFDTYYYILEPGNGRPPTTGYVTIVK